MLNTTNNTYKNEVNIKPACNGTLQQSHPKSIFLRFDVNSDLEDMVFSIKPHICKKYRKYDGYDSYDEYEDIDIVVLQVLCFGDDHYLCEVLEKKYLEENNEETKIE